MRRDKKPNIQNEIQTSDGKNQDIETSKEEMKAKYKVERIISKEINKKG